MRTSRNRSAGGAGGLKSEGGAMKRVLSCTWRSPGFGVRKTTFAASSTHRTSISSCVQGTWTANPAQLRAAGAFVLVRARRKSYGGKGIISHFRGRDPLNGASCSLTVDSGRSRWAAAIRSRGEQPHPMAVGPLRTHGMPSWAWVHARAVARACGQRCVHLPGSGKRLQLSHPLVSKEEFHGLAPPLRRLGSDQSRLGDGML